MSDAASEGERFDYIVVGAGSAGCALAARLAADGRHSVLLLDAGEDDRWIWLKVPAGVAHIVRGERALRRFFTEPEGELKNRKIFWPRGRVLGGSSTVNGMIWVHGDPAEYNLWREELGLVDWGHEQVKPVFRAIERYAGGDQRSRGRNGPVQITEYGPKLPLMRDFVTACGQAGIPVRPDYNGQEYEGVGFLQFNTRRGWRMGAREAYLKPALRRGGLALRQGALVQRVLFESRRAVGIEYRQGGRTLNAHCNREVVLCAGAVQSPQLLELSGVGRGALLQRLGVPVVRDLPAVGENLHDHLHTRMNYEVRDVATLNQIMPSVWRKGLMGMRWLARGNGLMSNCGQIVHALARSDPKSPKVEVKLQLHWLTSPDARDPNKLWLDDFRGVSVGTFALRPRSRGHVHISSRDAAQAPLMVANYLAHEEDRFNAIAALRLAHRVMAQPAMQRWVVREDRPGPGAGSDEELLDYIRGIGQISYHPVGPCRMGVDDASVVDPWLRVRVRGLEGLRVADASIFPTMPSANTNAPAMMVGERAAQFMLEAAQAR